MGLVIDAHQHYWQRGREGYDYAWLKQDQHAPINRDYLPSDLKPLIDEVGVQKTVFVQTQHSVVENRWVLELIEENDFIVGLVGWVDLYAEDVEDQLAEFKDHPKFVGIRHVVQDEPDEDWIVRPEAIRGLKVLQKHGVPYDLLFYTQHLKHAVRLGQELPDLPMVIDHLSKPKIKDGLIDDWAQDLRAAAAFPNIHCKLSGMVTEADWEKWSPSDLKPYVDVALEAFGVDRCIYGSDWPVCELAGSYKQAMDALNEVLGPLGEGERDKLFGENAAKFYALKL